MLPPVNVRRYLLPVSTTLRVNEVYLSLQGESTFAGLPCIFIRLTGCDLRCSYCDTAYAFTEGSHQPLTSVIDSVNLLAAPYRLAASPASTRLPLVELTGGEPLLQAEALTLMTALCDQGFTVLIETSGAHDISRIDPRVRRIVDLKCPSSGEVRRNRWENLPHLRPTDEVKFVIGTREDYAWTREVITTHQLAGRCALLVSWVHPLSPYQLLPVLKAIPDGQTPISRQELAEILIADALPVRFQAQLHKIIWPPDQRGV